MSIPFVAINLGSSATDFPHGESVQREGVLIMSDIWKIKGETISRSSARREDRTSLSLWVAYPGHLTW
jgi:hypothetical protein